MSLRALSMMSAKSHSTLAEGSERTARAMAALRRIERFGFRASTCDEGISPTNAARFGWRRCLPRTEAFE